MKYINFAGSKSKPKEGVYRIRVYSYDGSAHQGYGPVNSMAAHQLVIQGDDTWPQQAAEVTIPEEAIVDFGAHAVEKESEVTQGVPELQMFKLELLALPIFVDLIEATRDRDAQIWIEVVLEQPVLDAVPMAGRFCAPRKKRLHFWGKLNRAEFTGTVDRQKHVETGPSSTRTTDVLYHLGKLNLSFVHWLKVRCEEPVKDFLDTFREKYTAIDEDVQVSAVLYHLIKRLSPTPLFACADWRLDDLAAGSALDPLNEHRGACNFLLSYQMVDSQGVPTEWFDDIWCAIRLNNVYRTLFFSSETEASSNSLYSCRDLGELLVRLTGEFFLFPQVEIPTLEEAYKHFVTNNIHPERTKHWIGVTRWLFLEPDKPAIKVWVDPVQGSWEYNPAATWASEYKVEIPTRKDLLPAPAYAISKGFDGGSQHSYKTLFRFIGQEYINDVLQNSPMDTEFFVNGNLPFGSLPQNKKYITSVIKDGITYTNWAAFHADRQMNIWGSVRSTLKVKSRSHALEPFGANDLRLGVANKITPKQHFNRGDFGDFPLLREYICGIGLMGGLTKKLYRYVSTSVVRKTGSPAELTFIEIAPIDSMIDGRVVDSDPPVPPPPTDGDPPTRAITSPPTLSTVAGTTPIVVTATDPSGVAQVSMFINNVLLDTKVVSATGTYNFSWVTTDYADGSYTLKAVATDTAGNEGSTSVTVTVLNGGPP